MVGTLCLYVPDELIYACGADRVILCGGRSAPVAAAEEYLPRNLCPLIKSSFGSVIDQKCSKTKSCPHFGLVDLIVAEATCDGKKKMYELLNQYIPTHVVDLPQKPENQNALEYYIKLESLKDVLEKLTGSKITDAQLKNEIKSANETRKLLHALYELRKRDLPPIKGTEMLKVLQQMHFLSPDEFRKNLALLLNELKVKKRENSGPRIMISGCPMAAGNMKVPEIIENRGGMIVVEESCIGTRAFWDLVDENKDPMRAIAERYLKIPCACMYPNDRRINQIIKFAKDFNVDGVVYYTLQFCHGYNVEKYRVAEALKEAGIPLLSIETDYSGADTEQIKTRVDAFMEMLG
ncbi:MAG: double-cubane-cluster-containing anaerobic reductase [Candidatus Methanoperedens sp.]|nr:double-cubane-cluster-containing anaerobic reductase [Candidatus Methanoperedens sp.]